MVELQNDVIDQFALNEVKLLVKVLRMNFMTQDHLKYMKILEVWNGEFKKERTEPTLFALYKYYFTKYFLSENLKIDSTRQ
jgi:acyl-homoserine lactone acylase PvdQ